MNDLASPAGYLASVDAIGRKPLACHKYIRRYQAGGGAALNRNTHMGRLQRHCIVNTFSYHGNRAPLIILQMFYKGLLILWTGITNGMV